MTVTPSPQLYTPDDLADVLRADFATHGIDAVVEVGEFAPEEGRGEPRVWIAWGDFSAKEPEGRQDGGAWFPVPGKPGYVAAPIMEDAQRFMITVHAGGANRDEPVAVAARRATNELKRQTLRALREGHAAPFRDPIAGSWPSELPDGAEGYEGYTYGSVARFTVAIVSPVLRDPVKLGSSAGAPAMLTTSIGAS